MPFQRRYVLGGLLLASGVVAAVVLWDVAATVFFAVTVAYLLYPVRDTLTDRGLSPWGASLLSTLAVFLSILLAALPLVVVVAVRVDEVLAFLATAPEVVSVELFGMVYDVTVEQAIQSLVRVVTGLARTMVTAAPVFGLKLTVFAMLVFALCLHQRQARRAVLAVVPPAYRDVAESFNERTRETLFAIYVLQAATAVGTFLIALPVFFLLGYPIPITLAVVAAVLQFFPIVGPSVLLLVLAAYHLVVGEATAALLVVVVGGVAIAWLPDVLIRPRLAKRTTAMSGTLYFVGFVGGLLTLGVAGIIAGPLAIAYLVEAASILGAELNDIPVEED